MDTFGKGMYIWKLRGDKPEKLVNDLVSLRVSWAAIKIADGAATSDGTGTPAEMKLITDLLHAEGIKVWGWQYLYGGKLYNGADNRLSTPKAEAAAAAEMLNRLGLDGYIADPEREYKLAGAGAAAVFGREFRKLMGNDFPMGLSSYRFPKLHMDFPWAAWLDFANCHMPQVYWGKGGQRKELEKSITQLKALKDLPVIPAGRAYNGDGYSCPAGSADTLAPEIASFIETCKELKLGGCFFWALDFLRADYPHAEARKAAIRSTEWKPAAQDEKPAVLTVEQRLERLEAAAAAHGWMIG